MTEERNQISQKQLKAMGVSLPNGRYTKKTFDDRAEIYRCGGDTEGCILVGLERTGDGVGQSRSAMSELIPKLRAAYEKKDFVTIEVV